jgi:hypothetical protein
MQNYGGNALGLNAARSGGGNRGDNHAKTNSTRHCNNEQGIMSRIKRSVLMRMIPRCLHRDYQPPTSRSSRPMSQKRRAILHMAAGYALAWAFVQIPFIIDVIVDHYYDTLILLACRPPPPLQGLFNVLVFMSPKVRSAKRSRRGENLTWRTGVKLLSRHTCREEKGGERVDI